MATHKRVGFFFEQSVKNQQRLLDSLRCNVGHPREDEIVQYLNSGVDAGVAMIVEHDYLQEPPVALGEATLKTDGEWVWPASLTYYVREYHISLPQDFVEKMQINGWSVPPNAEYTPEIPEGHIEM